MTVTRRWHTGGRKCRRSLRLQLVEKNPDPPRVKEVFQAPAESERRQLDPLEEALWKRAKQLDALDLAAYGLAQALPAIGGTPLCRQALDQNRGIRRREDFLGRQLLTQVLRARL